MVSGRRDTFGIIFRRIVLFPNHVPHKTSSTEHFVAQALQSFLLVVVNGYEDGAVVRQQLAQQGQAGIHHAQPLVVPGEVLAGFAHDFAQPLQQSRVVHVVVVHPLLFPRVVGRVDVDALDASFVFGQESFQGFQVIAMDNLVAAAGFGFRPAFFRRKAVLVLQYSEGDFLMVVNHLFFSNPLE